MLHAQNYTVSGYVKDASNGETLIGATIFDAQNSSAGTVTNSYGFYSLTLPKGNYKIACSYIGFQNQFYQIDLSSNVVLNIDLSSGVFMDEIVVSEEKEKAKLNVQGTQMGTVELPISQVKKLPALLGEVDVLKTIQLLPGVLSSGEGNSGFYVRGGGPDQNLVLLDDALVYNSGHLLGFFSVFNSDAIKSTKLIKGGMPAQFGGRISSVLDVKMKEGNKKQFEVEGGIGLISSRFTLQGPILKDKISFIVAARRTYVLDLLQPFLDGTNFEGTNYFFYDLNTKINWEINEKNKVFFSGYFGRDNLIFNQPKRDFKFDLPYGNSTATLRWNHIFSNKLFMNMTAVYNDYDFSLNGTQTDFSFKLFSGVKDYALKTSFDYYPSQKHQIRFGVHATYHELTPNTASAQSGEVVFNSLQRPKYALESGIYVQDDWKLNDWLGINLGLRYSTFSQLGPYTSNIDSTEYEAFDFVKTYHGFEPRFSSKISFKNSQSIKVGLTRTMQYVHLVSNSASTLPTDVWSPSTERIAPQIGIQYALGYFKNWLDNTIETSIEVYYKDLQNQLDYTESNVNELGVDEELKFISGKGRAYGAEFFIKKAQGNFTGWIGYTLSKSELSFKDIEGGDWYPAVYDRPHDLSIVGNYQITDKWDVSCVFVYGTGKAYTPLTGIYPIEGQFNYFYAKRNSARFPDYHRADISATYTPNPKAKKRFKGSWVFSVYNVYNRKNPFFINFEQSESSTLAAPSLQGLKVTIFPLIPSISYNFKWQQKPKYAK